MATILAFFANFGKAILNAIQILWSILKWLFSKCWKVTLILGSLFLTIFLIKKVAKEE